MKSALQYLREILTLLGEDRRKLPALVVLFLGVSLLDLAGLGLIAPYIALVTQPESAVSGALGALFSKSGAQESSSTLIFQASVMLVSIFLIKAVASLGINIFIIRFAQRQQIRIRSQLMQAYQHLPYSTYLQRNSSEYIHSVQTLTAHFQTVFQQVTRTVSDGIIAFVIVSFLGWQNIFILTLLIALLGTVLFAYLLVFKRRMKDYGRRLNAAGLKMIKGVHEGLEGIKEIRVLGQEQYFHNAVREGAESWSFNQYRYEMLTQAPRYVLEATLVLFIALVVLTSHQLGDPASNILGEIGVFGVAALRLMPIASLFTTNLTSIRFHRDSISQLFHDLEELEPALATLAPPAQGEVSTPFEVLEVRELSYTYPVANIPALQQVNLTIRAGELIGIMGTSGSGKTTLVDALLGLLKPQTGSIDYNGYPLQESLKTWRSQVAYLPQQVFLIDNSLSCNVALGKEEAEIDQELLSESLRQARLSELVEQLPQGVNTILGERGVRLSGGQRQRVALARAFYHGRSVLVMDEATSALDNETEREIVEEIKRLKGQKTMIVIAHRLTTVQHCDRIYRLEQGQIVDEGAP